LAQIRQLGVLKIFMNSSKNWEANKMSKPNSQFHSNKKMKKEKRATQFYCPHCKSHKNPRKNIIMLLTEEPEKRIAAQCNKCWSVVDKVITIKEWDDFALKRLQSTFLEVRCCFTLNEYREKYGMLHIEHTIRKQNKLASKAPVDMYPEPEAEKILGLNQSMLQEFRMRNKAPRNYMHEGQIIYWKQDLMEWKVDFEQRNDL
jgi:hypothetical protein